MKKKKSVLDAATLSHLLGPRPGGASWEPALGDWVRALRGQLRMSQKDLAHRAGITQSHVAAIELGKIDPQIGTIKRLFDALSSDLVIQPRPRRPLHDVLLSQAGKVALARLKHSVGNVSLEGHAPSEEMFRQLLKKRTDEIAGDPREKIWRQVDE